ncbi:hypothetical protein ACQP2Y_44640 [Actinoplanes sp. CA-051413]|uniref:hypothetical protein n=1 Tax=Actinoplanes sp. CA-051413 TaxID=3239899 RepID=UPI003D9918CB
MRKWFYAGAVVGGFLLLGAAPAQADVVPAPAGGLLGSLGGGATQGLGLDPAGGLNLASPLDGSSLMDVKPGQNSADLTGPASGLAAQDQARTREADEPAGRRPVGGSAPADLPVIGGLTGGSSGGGLGGGGLGGGSLGGGNLGGGASRGTGGGLTGGGQGGGLPTGSLSNLIPANLLGGGLLGGGLTPDGRTASAEAPRESALFDGGVPLLGGLGGLLPANETPRTLPATGDDTPTGMPAGGTDVDPTLVDPAPGQPSDGPTGDDQAAGPAADQPIDDPRLHEEPVDDEAGGKKRSFSDGGRPIAGEDEDFR